MCIRCVHETRSEYNARAISVVSTESNCGKAPGTKGEPQEVQSQVPGFPVLLSLFLRPVSKSPARQTAATASRPARLHIRTMSENTPLIHARGFTALTVEQPGEVLTECFPAESVLAPGNMHRRECRERKEDPCAPRRDRTISNDWLATDSAAATQPARAPAHPWRRMIDQSHQTSFRRQADLSDDAEQQPGQALSGSETVTAQLVLPERMHVKIPIIASMKRDKHGEKLLCLRIPGTRAKRSYRSM